MNYDGRQLRKIYDKTAGRCHICHKALALTNHGRVGRKGAWEVDHSRPRARGGSNYIGNLLPACADCNRTKGAGYNRTMRAKFGHSRAPLSREEESQREIVVQVLVVAGIGLAIWLLIKWLDQRNSKPQSTASKMLGFENRG